MSDRRICMVRRAYLSISNSILFSTLYVKTGKICFKFHSCSSVAGMSPFGIGSRQMTSLSHSLLFHNRWKCLRKENAGLKLRSLKTFPASPTPSRNPVCAYQFVTFFAFPFCFSSSAPWQIIINRIKAYERASASERLSLGSWVTKSDSSKVLNCFCHYMQPWKISLILV